MMGAFQKVMDNIINGLKNMYCFLVGNIVIGRESLEEHSNSAYKSLK